MKAFPKLRFDELNVESYPYDFTGGKKKKELGIMSSECMLSFSVTRIRTDHEMQSTGYVLFRHMKL